MTKEPTRELAEEMGVSRRQARYIKAAGTDKGPSKTSRERWEKARADRAELALKLEQAELDKTLGRLIPVESISADLRAIGEELKAALAYELEDQLPIINEGLSAEKQRHNNHAAFLRLLSRWREFAVKNGAKE